MERLLTAVAAAPSLDAFSRALARTPRSPVDSPPALKDAAELMAQRLQEAGCEVETRDVPFRGDRFQNVFGIVPGRRDGPPLVIATHHDSAPGSPDQGDANGTIVLLEVARLMARTVPRTPLIFASYTLRYWGMAGSGQHARRLWAENEPIAGMINLGTFRSAGPDQPIRRTGPWTTPFRARRAHDLVVVGNLASRRLLRHVVRGLRKDLHVGSVHLPGRGFIAPALRNGDHASFWDRGFPAVRVSEPVSLRDESAPIGSTVSDADDLSHLTETARSIAGVVGNLLE